ncbi:hypothetical protein Desdi_0226 [Desulfitobacterium dichloroeliminans LMG P-21439]|uniref:Uncharacterized protein n=1 Tax=Desulfitobacterium dichloroeliminans (strain LMG P-21439 / DCA1) TaxID=871963 RepID=L0F529_DESDL|nr:hypothetical protein Desdi_0226 [Desulfitobacterium dichloroeliminans LMG P-21439]
MPVDKGKVVDFQQYKEKREIRGIEEAISYEEENSDESEFRAKLQLSQKDAEMVIYCLRLGREYFKIEDVGIADEDNQPQNDLEKVNHLLDRIQYEALKLHTEDEYIFRISLLELIFIIDCVEMTRNAASKGINVFQAEPEEKENYIRWLDGTFVYLLDVYEKWRFFRNS